MKSKKIDIKLFESLFSDDELGVTDEQKAAHAKKQEQAAKKSEAAKKAAKTRQANKTLASELRNDNDLKRQGTFDGMEKQQPKHKDKHIEEFSKTGKVPKELKNKKGE